MNIRIFLWTLCMASAGFLLVGSTPFITGVGFSPWARGLREKSTPTPDDLTTIQTGVK